MTINLDPVGDAKYLPHPKYRADIDGLRAIAVLSVVGFHAFPNWIKGGFIGVDIFFVISGFLISTIIFKALEQGTFSFLEFYSRRIKRIFPALLLVLVGSYAFGWVSLFADEYKQLGKHIAGCAAFVANVVQWNETGYFNNDAATQPLLHLWSLGLEEQFYIAWPLLLCAAWKRRFNLLATMLVMFGISFALNIAQVHNNPVAVFYSPQTRFWELLAGSLLAYIALNKGIIFPGPKPRFNTWLNRVFDAQTPEANETALRNAKSISGIALIIIGAIVINKDKFYPGWWAVVPTVGAVLIISAGMQAWLNRAVLSNRVLVWFGLISFPLYLWHWPLLSFARILEGETPAREIRIAAVASSIVLAWLTYRLIEKPIRFGRHGKAKTIILLVFMLMVGYLGYDCYRQDGLISRNIVIKNIEPEQEFTYRSNSPSRCTGVSRNSIVNELCTTYPAPHPQRTILLWGDSSTNAWLPVFLDIGKEKQYTIVNISHASCPPLIAARKTTFEFPENEKYCGDGKMQEQVIDLIKSIRPDAIVLIAAWNAYSPYSSREFITDESNDEANWLTTQRTIVRRTPETLNRLEKISKLIVFKSWPVLKSSPNYRFSEISLLGKWFERKSTPLVFDIEEFRKDSALINDTLNKLYLSNTVFFNPSEKICADRCVIMYNQTRMYNDKYHITPQGSMLFRDEIQQLLE